MKKSLSLLLLLASLGLGCFTYSVETLAASVSGEARIAVDMPAPKRVVKPIPATKSIVRKQIAKLKADLMTLNLSIKSIEKKLALSKK